ncbi:MAG: hypothetical protein E6G31_02120, partial [Actinobacteria bacterium]
MLACLEQGPELRPPVQRGELGDPHQLPGVREVHGVACGLEDVNRPLRDVSQYIRRRPLLHVGHPGQLDFRVQLRVLVSVATGVCDRLGENRRRTVDGAAIAKRASQVGKQRRMLPGVDLEQAAGALEERDGCAGLEAIERSTPGTREQPASPAGLLFSCGVHPAELDPVLVRLFQVVADDLVGRAEFVGMTFEPRGEPRVELGSQLLRNGRVRDVADQHMVEAKAVVAGEQGAVGADELLSRQREQDRSETGRLIRWDEVGDGAAMEQ